LRARPIPRRTIGRIVRVESSSPARMKISEQGVDASEFIFATHYL